MTKEQINRLRDLAGKATQGQWRCHEDNSRVITSSLDPHMSLLGVDKDGQAIVFEQNDANFISAANPAAIIYLLDILDYAEKTLNHVLTKNSQ